MITSLKTFFFFLFAVSVSPLGAQILPECAPALAGFSAGQVIERRALFSLVNSRLGLRMLGMGGPIAQPKFFVGIRIPPAVTSDLASSGRKNRSADTEILGLARTIGAENLGQEIDLGNIRLPVVLRPNQSAPGTGELFLERGGNVTTLTMALGDVRTTNVTAECRRMGISVESKFPKENIVQVSFETNRFSTREVVSRIWKRWAHLSGESPQFDAGVLESVHDTFRYQGKAYETRHEWTAEIRNGRPVSIRLLKYLSTPHYATGNLARVGSSPYFSHHHEQLEAEKMYQPLFDGFRIEGQQKADFNVYADSKVIKQIFYYLRRLRGSGIYLNGILYGHLDLRWLSFNPEGTSLFPEPLIVEGGFIGDETATNLVVTKK